MSLRFNPPPNWPRPPVGWTPPPGWRPDPSWGPPPHGWRIWVEEPAPFAPRPVSLAPRAIAQPSPSNGHAMVAVAAVSCGLAGFAPPLWAARQRPNDEAFRRRMHATSGGLFALMASGLIMIAAANENESGAPSGLVGDLGGALFIINMIVAVTVAALLRNTQPEGELPGVAEERARRRLREQYRKLAQDDPSMARSLRVGRPDLPRNLDDGGLLDLNAIPAQYLCPCAELSPDEARRVAEARQQAGPFASIEEVAHFADLPDSTVDTLRERAVFFR